jgi:hypothetical protein
MTRPTPTHIRHIRHTGPTVTPGRTYSTGVTNKVQGPTRSYHHVPMLPVSTCRTHPLMPAASPRLPASPPDPGVRTPAPGPGPDMQRREPAPGPASRARIPHPTTPPASSRTCRRPSFSPRSDATRCHPSRLTLRASPFAPRPSHDARNRPSLAAACTSPLVTLLAQCVCRTNGRASATMPGAEGYPSTHTPRPAVWVGVWLGTGGWRRPP